MNMNIKQMDTEYIANTYARFPVQLVSGKGSVLKDETGKEYVDMGSGIAVNAFGAADDEWVAAVTEQLNKLSHTSNLYYTEPGVQLAKLLCEKTGMKKVFFCNSGAEANECAIKTARKYAAEKKGAEYYTIITLKDSFHGRTITTLAATGQEHYHELFQPLTPGFVYADASDIDDVKRLVAENKVAAIMFEIVQGEGGVNPLSGAFVKGLAKIAEENDVLLIADEVQIGNGRSGKFYGYMHYGITPDIVTTAKGLGGGLPIGAVLFGEKTKSVLGPGDHGTTYGGNPAACAGALSVISRIDDKLMAEISAKSARIFDALLGAKGVKSVAGLGLMIGVETEKPADEVIDYCREHGVLVLKAKSKVRLLPALNIPDDKLEYAINVIKQACAG